MIVGDEPHDGQESLEPFFYDVAELPGYTIVDLLGDAPESEQIFEVFGRDLVTKAIVQTPKLSVFHECAKPGERVKPHRHGTHQLTYVIRGELIYGTQKTTAGMGYFSPDTLYSWRAGDEGAEWIEIHAGEPAVFLDRPGT
jgi:hypothetical protein